MKGYVSYGGGLGRNQVVSRGADGSKRIGGLSPVLLDAERALCGRHDMSWPHLQESQSSVGCPQNNLDLHVERLTALFVSVRNVAGCGGLAKQ